MAFSGPVEDRLAIHELVASYGDAVTRRSAEDWGALWAEDSAWLMPGIPGFERFDGRKAIVAAWIQGMAMWPFQVNIQTCGHIVVNGNTASGRAYTSERVKDTDGKPAIWTNLYTDEYVKIGGRWLFKSRTLKILDINTAA
jgi:ketosteroid isomerase-like protein